MTKRKLTLGDWIFYMTDDAKFDNEKVGKWTYYFDKKVYASIICKETVENNIVKEAKYRDIDGGVACFYLHIEDIEGHKRILTYF